MKRPLFQISFAALIVAFAFCLTERTARAGDFYFYAGPSYYVAPPVYYYAPPVYVAPAYVPAPIVSYGYVAGPPVAPIGIVQPAYYYPETVGIYAPAPYFPAEVKYKWRHGMLKVEIDD